MVVKEDSVRVKDVDGKVLVGRLLTVGRFYCKVAYMDGRATQMVPRDRVELIGRKRQIVGAILPVVGIWFLVGTWLFM